VWDRECNCWRGEFKKEFWYNANNQKTSEEESWHWDSGYWKNHRRKEFSYNSLGKLDVINRFVWDTTLEKWELNGKWFHYYTNYHHYADSEKICNNDSLFWRGRYLKKERIYYSISPQVTGSDSIYEISLEVHSSPGPYTIEGNTSVVSNEIYTYIIPGNEKYTYSWSVNNGTIILHPNDYSAEVRWGNPGIGKIEIVTQSPIGCFNDTSELEVLIGSVGIETSLGNSIMIYPNPTEDHLIIESNNRFLLDNYRIRIMNQTGIIVFETGIVNDQTQLDLAAFTNRGLYLIQLIDNEGRLITTRKIILQ
jgi:hypothetical protein